MDDAIFDPPHQEMGRHVRTGLLSSGAAQIVKIGCQFTSVVVLSRLLPPSDFGLVAMAGPVYAFVSLFLDLGLNQATIQKKSLTHAEVNAFFWINLAVGLALTIVLGAASPLAGWYYGDGRVTGLTAAMAGLIVISALGNQHNAILRRRMSFRAASLIDVIGTVAGLGVSIAAALILKTYWALYDGMAAAIIVPVIGSWIATRWRPSLPHIPRHIGGSIKFGLGITSFNMTNFFARNLDNVLIGRFCGSLVLGLYDRAYKLLLFPLQRIVGPITDVMLPVLSKLQHEPDAYRRLYMNLVSQLLLITWPGILCAIVFGPALIATLLGPQWAGSAAIFLPLAIVALVQMVNNPSGLLFITQGRSGHYAKWGIIGGATSVASFVIGLPFGAVGVATAYAAAEYIRTPFLWRYATRQGPVGIKDVLAATLPAIGAAFATLLGLIMLRYSQILSGLPLLIVAGSMSYAIFTAALSLFPSGRATVKHLFRVNRQPPRLSLIFTNSAAPTIE